MSEKKTALKIFYLVVGVMFSWFTYDLVLRTTDNPLLAVFAMTIVLAFWIGTLVVRIKGEF
jgi:hypothetical protein